MSERPSRLFYAGDGSAFVVGVPRRDLDGREVARMTDQQYRDATEPHPETGRRLYHKSKPRAADGGDARGSGTSRPPEDAVIDERPAAAPTEGS